MERTAFEPWKPREVARLLALIETERRYYQEMLAALPVALAVLASDRTILSTNRAFRSTIKLRSEDLRNKSIEQILPSDELIERIRSAHVHGESAPFTLTIGGRVLRATAVPIRGLEEDMPAETMLMIEDLAGVELPTPLAPVSVGIDPSAFTAILWEADASTLAFTYASNAAERLLGYPASRWLSSPAFFSERIHPEDRAGVMALYRAVIESGAEAGAEYRHISAAGEAVWCRETIRVPKPGAGTRTITGVLTVIQQRRQLEVQALNAGRIDALRGLASRLAHDLNNPLMVITGYAEEVLNGLDRQSPLRNEVSEILTAAGRIGELSGELQGFVHPQAKSPARLSLNRIITDIGGRLKEIAGDSVEMKISSPPSDLWVVADQGQLEEAILAFASSAMENTRDVSRLDVICRSDFISERVESGILPPGACVRLDLHAVGAGLGTPAAGIFESFLYVKDPRKAAGPAVARAYANVRRWGGDVAFSSSAASGSIFTVFLPSKERESVAPQAAAEPAPAIRETPGKQPPATILLVEDEPGIRSLIRKILLRENYRVLESGSAEEALSLAGEHKGTIDLLVTDVMLPGMSGPQFAQLLRRTRPELKIVYVSGYTDDEAVRAGEFPPGSKFLQKPFTLEALTSKVREALGRP